MTDTIILDNSLRLMGWSFASMSPADLADKIGPLERDAYFELLSTWRSSYRSLGVEVREARALRKTGTEDKSKDWWASHRQALRWRGYKMMCLRAAIKELARRHWESRQAA